MCLFANMWEFVFLLQNGINVHSYPRTEPIRIPVRDPFPHAFVIATNQQVLVGFIKPVGGDISLLSFVLPILFMRSSFYMFINKLWGFFFSFSELIPF